MSERPKLGARVLVQMLVFAALVGAVTFVPAGTLDYAGGWRWLVLFFGSSAAITACLYVRDPKLLERRLAVAESGEPTVAQKIAQGAAAIAFFGMVVIAGLDHRWQLTSVPGALVAVGSVLVVGGFAVVFEVFRENTFASSVVTVERDQRVIDTGLYGRVRHPMYSGGFSLIYGTPLVLGSYVALVACPILTIVIVLRARDEERLLARDLPGYAEYMQRVRWRFVPYIA